MRARITQRFSGCCRVPLGSPTAIRLLRIDPVDGPTRYRCEADYFSMV
jgi:hypothetical protein